jgi:hypothetical protein
VTGAKHCPHQPTLARSAAPHDRQFLGAGISQQVSVAGVGGLRRSVSPYPDHVSDAALDGQCLVRAP